MTIFRTSLIQLNLKDSMNTDEVVAKASEIAGNTLTPKEIHLEPNEFFQFHSHMWRMASPNLSHPQRMAMVARLVATDH